MTWLGYKTEIFNVGNYRRKLLGAHQSHDFFDPNNEQGMGYRQQVRGGGAAMSSHDRVSVG